MTEKKGEMVEAVAPKTLNELFTSDHVKQALAIAAPKHLDVERFIRICQTAIQRNSKLQQCTVMSFWNCMIELSVLGLEPDGRRAHLIPYKNVCTLIIDYKGLVECIMRSPDVSYITAELVRENDDFLYDKGQVVRHVIDFKAPRGKVYAVYSHARMENGNDLYEVMDMEDIEKVRDKSPAWRWAESGDKKKGGGKKDSIWHEWEGQMMKKSAIRRHSNVLPLPSEIRDVVTADDSHQYDGMVRATVTAGNLLDAPNGSRISLTAPETEPEPESEPPAAEPGPNTECLPDDVTIEQALMTLDVMTDAQKKMLAKKAGLDPKEENLMASDSNVVAMYMVHIGG